MTEHLNPDELAGLVMLEADDAERLRAESHVAECADCRAAWGDAARTMALLEALPEPAPPSSGALSRARAAVLQELDAESRLPRRREEGSSLWAALAIPLLALLALVLLLAVGASTVVHWRMAVLALVVSGGRSAWALYRGASREAWIALAFTLGISLLMTVIYVDPQQAMALGPGCTIQELAAAMLPLGAALYFARSGVLGITPWSLGAAAACGALAGQVALLSLCPHRDPIHLFTLHSGGVALAALAGVGLGRLLPSR